MTGRRKYVQYLKNEYAILDSPEFGIVVKKSIVIFEMVNCHTCLSDISSLS